MLLGFGLIQYMERKLQFSGQQTKFMRFPTGNRGYCLQLMDRNPEFAQVLNNPQQLQEAMQAAANPVSCWLETLHPTLHDNISCTAFPFALLADKHLLHACTWLSYCPLHMQDLCLHFSAASFVVLSIIYISQLPMVAGVPLDVAQSPNVLTFLTPSLCPAHTQRNPTSNKPSSMIQEAVSCSGFSCHKASNIYTSTVFALDSFFWWPAA